MLEQSAAKGDTDAVFVLLEQMVPTFRTAAQRQTA
jgi:hypothetical protein